MTDVFTAYATAFQRCYPTYTVTFERAKKSPSGQSQFNVVLNGDPGNLPMTMDDLREAVVNLSR